MFRRKVVQFLVLIVIIQSTGLINGQRGQEVQLNNCREIKDCQQCISSRWKCTWCKNPIFEAKSHQFFKQISRCDTLENHLGNRNGLCDSMQNLEIPNSYSRIMSNNPVGKMSTGTIHISPQSAKVKLAVEKPVILKMTYFEDPDKRLDLYYLHDLSYTMMDDKETVAKQSQEIVQELKKITADIQLGFGSFVDKPVLPYINYKQKLGKVSKNGVKPYGFQNHLSLTRDTDTFTTAVKNSKISENIDQPEGGFDALMQSIVCNSIGWRNNSHKLIVLATDGNFHIAGDGKIGGIVIPNDMQCHLDTTGSYTHSTILDYPSIGQINYVVRKTGTYVIFAVTESRVKIYEELTTLIDKSKAAVLRSNSDNIVKIISDQYKNIKGQVQIRATESVNYAKVLHHIEIQYKARCKGNWVESDTCKDVGPGEQIEFTVQLRLLSCPPVLNSQIEFSTFELQESFKIDLEFDCTCNCSQSDGQKSLERETVISICGEHSKQLKCGRCECDDMHSGVNCECSTNGREQGFNRTNCQLDINDPTECSNRGQCKCGQCECTESKFFWGDYCQCDRSKCRLNPRNENEVECSGKGSCDCEHCKCDSDRGGDKCQCSNNRITCNEPGSIAECNSQGNCICMQQQSSFSSITDWQWMCSTCTKGYSGKYCHICRGPNCPKSSESQTWCQNPDLLRCLRCHINDSDYSSVQNPTACRSICDKGNSIDNDIRKFGVLIEYDFRPSEVEDKVMCTLQYNDTCRVNFHYNYDNEDRQKLEINVQKRSMLCAPPTDWLSVIVFGAGGVLFLGLLTILLWKLFTSVHDRREFTRFEKERAAAKWAKGENPLYSAPMSTFENPAYGN